MPGAAMTAKNHVIFPFRIVGSTNAATPTNEIIPPASSHRQPARSPPTMKTNPMNPNDSVVKGWATTFATIRNIGIPSPTAMIIIIARARALTIRAIQRHTVEDRLFVFIDGRFD